MWMKSTFMFLNYVILNEGTSRISLMKRKIFGTETIKLFFPYYLVELETQSRKIILFFIAADCFIARTHPLIYSNYHEKENIFYVSIKLFVAIRKGCNKLWMLENEIEARVADYDVMKFFSALSVFFLKKYFLFKVDYVRKISWGMNNFLFN